MPIQDLRLRVLNPFTSKSSLHNLIASNLSTMFVSIQLVYSLNNCKRDFLILFLTYSVRFSKFRKYTLSKPKQNYRD